MADDQSQTRRSRHLLHPELHEAMDARPQLQITAEAVPAIRAVMEFETIEDPLARGVERREIELDRPNGEGAVRCLMYTPQARAERIPAYLHIHGGGYLIGAPEMSDPMNVLVASKLGCIVLSVDYRLAPEHPAPAGIDDCFLALAWLHEEAEDLGIDAARIAIGGESAGGGMAASLALKARDDGRFPICHQQLTYPMIDDRTGRPGQPLDAMVGEYVWTPEMNVAGWDMYLAGAEPAAPTVAARAESLAGLPPTWIMTGTLDLFRDENIAYANRLMAAQVPTDLSVYAGACHAFQAVTESELAQRFVAEHLAALARGLSA